MRTGQNVFNAILNDGHREKNVYLTDEIKKKCVWNKFEQHIQHFSGESSKAIKHFGKVVSTEPRAPSPFLLWMSKKKTHEIQPLSTEKKRKLNSLRFVLCFYLYIKLKYRIYDSRMRMGMEHVRWNYKNRRNENCVNSAKVKRKTNDAQV